MTYFFRDNDIKGLNCRMCQRLYRSGLGMFTHLETCGEQQKRVNCEHCGKSYTKMSLVQHMRSCAVRLQQEQQSNKDQSGENGQDSGELIKWDVRRELHK